ncbi:hypothetical protein D9615_003184 [Tricholomella constricta]|uniref:Uncharacterized protein n=1 Tax=Tricholomella constricta TaxID=117010 RepID=A0A8H5M7I8_9AGAR|nr:hypothetical protein D9615_003184 [Tricholomella constricta]
MYSSFVNALSVLSMTFGSRLAQLVVGLAPFVHYWVPTETLVEVARPIPPIPTSTTPLTPTPTSLAQPFITLSGILLGTVFAAVILLAITGSALGIVAAAKAPFSRGLYSLAVKTISYLEAHGTTSDTTSLDPECLKRVLLFLRLDYADLRKVQINIGKVETDLRNHQAVIIPPTYEQVERAAQAGRNRSARDVRVAQDREVSPVSICRRTWTILARAFLRLCKYIVKTVCTTAIRVSTALLKSDSFVATKVLLSQGLCLLAAKIIAYLGTPESLLVDDPPLYPLPDLPLPDNPFNRHPQWFNALVLLLLTVHADLGQTHRRFVRLVNEFRAFWFRHAAPTYDQSVRAARDADEAGTIPPNYQQACAEGARDVDQAGVIAELR